MEKVVVIQKTYDAENYWENGKAAIFKTSEDAIKYVKDNMVKDVKQALLDDIDNGADENIANQLISLLDEGWDNFEDNIFVEEFMEKADYDFGLGACDYEFGYNGFDGDPWSVGYDIIKAEEVK